MNSYGTNIKLTVFGQSHAKSIGVVIDGLCAGTEIDEKYVEKIMALRAPGNSPLATKRKEPDKVEFVAGVENGKATGSAINAIIYNTDTRSSDYSNLTYTPRPSHADFPAMVRYGDAFDLRGGGQFSGRLTAPICIAGAIALSLLEKSGISVATHILSVGNVSDTPFSATENENELMNRLSSEAMPVIDTEAKEKMTATIEGAAKDGDSVGGVIECKITGLPVGIGEPMFDGIENSISRIIFGIPAVKGIEFGAGFEGSRMYGSQYNDSYYFENGVIKTKTNNAGGICGGMTTGMPIVFKIAMKPTPSIAKEQQTVNLKTGENTTITVNGRHDPCIALRAAVVVRAAAAFAIYDLLNNKK